ncbi:DUF1746-domain-containing protein [Xylaria arbuscula]|nr:DUF1746-domain-containing protein [Xylaria arbuscula]
MNNDPSPTLPADRPLLSSQHHEAHTNIHQTSSQSPSPDRRQHASANAQNPSLSPSAKEGLTKKLDFLSHLCLNLDTLVFAEFCSFFRLLLRWMAQTLFASPKAEDTLMIVPNYHISAIVAPNLLCIFLHLIYSPLQAGEASRGYLHGGILVDFIGQTPPSSRFTLILLDMIVLAIQCFMITVNIEKERIRVVVRPPQASVTPAVAVTMPVTIQDHDAEERGVMRDAPEMDEVNETDELEMRPLGNHVGGGVGDGEHVGDEGTRLLRQSDIRRTGRLGGYTDVLRSGNAVIGNFNIPRSLRTAWHSTGRSPELVAAYALQNAGYNATLAALAAQRGVRLNATQSRQS